MFSSQYHHLLVSIELRSSRDEDKISSYGCSMTTTVILSKEMIAAGLPLTIQSITGIPMLSNLFRAYHHLIWCTQSQFTAYHILNRLFLAVSQEMWKMHSVDPHPGPPENPGLAHNYCIIGTPLDIIKAKDKYNNKKKTLPGRREYELRTNQTFLVSISPRAH